MEVTAKARYVRMAPRKIRLLVDLVRGKDLEAARAELRLVNKRATTPVLKLIESAMANAEHNHQLDRYNLYIKAITADEGPVMKRWLPRAFGRATPLLKRSTHLAVILSEKVPSSPKEKPTAKSAKAVDVKLKAKPVVEPSGEVGVVEKINPEQESHQAEPFDQRRLGGQWRDTGHQDKRQLQNKKTKRQIFNRKSG